MENENEQVETVDTAELDAAFDDGWGDDDIVVTTDTGDEVDLGEDTDDTSEEQTEEADMEETGDEPEESDAEPEEGKEAEATEADNKGEDQLFDIKVNGESKRLSREQLIELAQKGADYDRVKQERDTFKQDAPTIQRYKEYEAFLKELAEKSDTDVDGLIDHTRARILMNTAEATGETLTEEEALSRVRQAKQSKETPAPAEQKPAETPNKMLVDFLAIYPDVDPKSIPQQVWDESHINNDLVGAYQRYENRQLKSKLARLEQNQKNKERSTGSRRTAGAATPKDAFDEGWDSLD